MESLDLGARLLLSGTELGDRFRSWASVARAEHPQWQLGLEAFAEHVAGLLAAAQRETAFHDLHAGDLYLAAGCMLGDKGALAAFEERHLRSLRSRIGEIDGNPARLDELKQLLRERLLVPDAPGAKPRIGTYSGRGPLGAWVQIAARRLALTSLRQKPTAELPHDDALDAQLLVGTDPELDYARLRYAPEFRQALEEALQQLSSHERLLLRLHWLDGVSLTRIARAYQVSQSTISRQLQHARDTVGSRMKARLKALLGITASEFESLLRLVESRFELSLARALRSDAEHALHGAAPSDADNGS